MLEQQDEHTGRLTPEDIQELRDLLQKLDDKLRSATIAPTLQEHDLLAGLTQPEQYTQIETRLTENADEKQSLSVYLAKTLLSEAEQNDKLMRIFVESGSTLAYFAAQLAQEIRDGPATGKGLEILTNNFLALTAFGVGRVAVTPGSLEPDYLSFLPFRNAHRTHRLRKDEGPRRNLTSITEQDRASDIEAFRNLDQAVGSVDLIYMTASHFGFLIGPHVGSRANAIFKYCLLNNRAHRKIRLCIAQSKIHCEGGPLHEVSAQKVKEMLCNECYTVFNLGQRLHYPKDPDVLTDFLVMAEAKQDSSPLTDPEEHEDQLRSAPTEMGLPMSVGESDVCEGYGLTGLHGTWKSFLKNCSPGYLEIIIGLRQDQESLARKTELRQAMYAANDILTERESGRGWELDRVYAEVPESEENAGVFHVTIARADGQ